MPGLVLYDYYRSSASYRVRIALELKGLDYERVPVDLLTGGQKGEAYRARNPQGFVPMLEADGLRITQSLAIIDWLDHRVCTPRLVPEAPQDRAHVLAMALTVACDIHPLNNLRVLKHLTGPLEQNEESRNQWVAHWIREGFSALEALASPRAGRFLFGDEPGLADICLVPQMYNARRFSVPVDDFPTLNRAVTEALRVDAFQRASPEQVKS